MRIAGGEIPRRVFGPTPAHRGRTPLASRHNNRAWSSERPVARVNKVPIAVCWARPFAVNGPDNGPRGYFSGLKICAGRTTFFAHKGDIPKNTGLGGGVGKNENLVVAGRRGSH